MANRRLSTAEDIELVNSEFKNDNWEQAANEIQRFWADGVRTYVSMGERGSYSRSMYRNVFEKHFVAHYEDEPSISVDESGVDISDLPLTESQFMELYQAIYRDIYSDAFQDGANWATEQQ